ncbi:MAG: O-antigen ligase family protein [Candidatus Acidiferrum sp.]|jgi:exopolysaccharide production protein ExoQ
MTPSLATFVCIVGVLGLFYLDRDKNLHTSKALWIPVLWVLISGSRPVSIWFGIGSATSSASQLLDGSPMDRLISAILIAAGLVALLSRPNELTSLLRKNWPILLYFSYCLLSVMWSDFPEVALKRWIKAIGDLVMVIVVVTDAQPIAALRRLITRTGFVLFPASILLIKYYGDWGRAYDTWSGEPTNIGVTVTKNMLGVLTFVLSLGALWLVLRLMRDKNQTNRLRHFIAQGTLLAFGLSLLSMAHSATSGICFTLGSVLIFATSLEWFRKQPRAVHALVLSILIIGGTAVLFGDETVAQAVGRKTNLTGRTEIWQTVIPMVPNRLLGAGFDSFWLGARLEKIWSLYPTLYLNEAHNGYIQTYLDLGVVGVFLIALILLSGYRNAVKSFRYEEASGANSLMLAYVFTAAFYSITEAGFRQMFVIWIFLLLAIVGSSQVTKVRAENETIKVDEPPALRPNWRQNLVSTTSHHG